MRTLRLGFSIADQSLRHTKSVGILNVSLGLLRSLAQRPEFSELVVFTNSSLTLPGSSAVKITTESHDAATRGWARALWDQWGVYGAVKKAGCDWLFLPKGYASFVKRAPVRLAVYVHDAMQDFYRSNYPKGYASIEKPYFARSYRASLRNADLVFTNSEFTASEVKRMAGQLGLRAPRVVVAGVGFDPIPPSSAQKQDQITTLVSRWPHKLTKRALEWLGRWQTQRAYKGSVRLVGDLPAGVDAPSFANWKFSERLSDADFEDVLGRSKTLIYFSEYEGFGMPPIEGILRGTAPVYSNIAAMMESAGEAGFSFDNNSYDNFADAMDKALACPREQLASWAEELVQRHSWARVAERVATALSQFPK
jgi:glycosyltransferase involved in cell wall biosynthesis